MQAVYRRIFFVIVLLSLSIVPSAVSAASNPPPETDEKTVFTGVSGAAITPGWNFIMLGPASCSVGTILDELQSDAGGGIRIDALWVSAGTTILAGQTWKEYAAADPTAATTLIPAGAKLALYSASRFYVDMNGDSCSKQRPVKQQEQINQARATAVENVTIATPPKQNVPPLSRITKPALRAFSWIAGAWTDGIRMVWSQVTGAWGKITTK